jgi:diacylglycerol kinase (ATP)
VSDYSKITAILNPAAGGGGGAARAEEALRALPGVRLVRTSGPGDGQRLAREAVAAGAEVVVACGGDGTVFEVANGLMPEARAALAVLPVGTGNSFVRDLGLADLDAAVGALKDQRRRKIDVLKVEHTGGVLYSVNLVSYGFSAVAGELTNRRFKPMGSAGYVSAVLASLVRLKHHVVPNALDGGAFDSRPMTLLSFCNSRYTGGAMMMAPPALVDDGLVDVVRIGPMNRRRFIACFPKIFRGTHPEMPEVQLTRAHTVSIARIGPLPVMIDGEVQQIETTRIEVLSRALEVIA